MTYTSLLRGINVSGQKPLKMADLKALYESLDFDGVTTYVQSGNVVFLGVVASTRNWNTVKALQKLGNALG